MNWDEIKEQVEDRGGARTFTMEILRDANGSKKLGVNVRSKISQKLAGLGLGHAPAELPDKQHKLVRLYMRGTPVGQLIDSVLSLGEERDIALVARVGTAGPDHAAIIQKIRELVAE